MLATGGARQRGGPGGDQAGAWASGGGRTAFVAGVGALGNGPGGSPSGLVGNGEPAGGLMDLRPERGQANSALQCARRLGRACRTEIGGQGAMKLLRGDCP